VNKLETDFMLMGITAVEDKL